MILQEQDPWNTTSEETKAWKQVDELLAFIPNKALQIELKNKWKGQTFGSTSKENGMISVQWHQTCSNRILK